MCATSGCRVGCAPPFGSGMRHSRSSCRRKQSTGPRVGMEVQGARFLISMPEPHVQGCPCELSGRCRHQAAAGVCGWQGAGRGKCRSLQLVPAAAYTSLTAGPCPCCCLQTTKPPQKLKKKTVYFVKTAPQRIDNDNIRKAVRCLSTPAWRPKQQQPHHMITAC